jgi:hypothetical protein
MSNEIVKLKIVGVLSRKWFPKFNKSLSLDKFAKNEVVLFCDFSSFDIPLGFRFKSIRSPTNVELFRGDIELTAISQAFAINFDYIPKGHKTLCKFRFNDQLPLAVSSFPIVEDWYELDTFLIFEDR